MSTCHQRGHPLEQLGEEVVDVEMAERRVGHGLDGSQSILNSRARHRWRDRTASAGVVMQPT